MIELIIFKKRVLSLFKEGTESKSVSPQIEYLIEKDDVYESVLWGESSKEAVHVPVEAPYKVCFILLLTQTSCAGSCSLSLYDVVL